MKITTIAGAFAAAGAVGILVAPIAAAEGPTTTTLGSQGKLVDAAGDVVQSWTLTNLKPSSDVIPHGVNGTLWEATATDEAVQGGVTPIVSNLNARAKSGETYRVLFGAATPQGVNPATLAQGEKTTGKVYFDVTGDAPDSVVYNSGDQDLLVWLPAPPARKGGTGTRSTPSASSSTPAAAAPAAAAPAANGATPAGTPGATPATGAATEGTPLPAATEGTPGEALPAGSQGTPLPAGSQGTPLPAGSQGTPLPAGSQGTPIAGEQSTGTAPAAVGSQGTPLPVAAGPVTP